MSGNLGLRNIKYVFKVLYQIRNWWDYFLDLFNLIDGPLVTFRFRNGLKYLCRSKTTDRGIITSTALADEYLIKNRNLKNATVIDLGGQIGAFSITISKSAKRVFVYEPMPENFSMLQKNIATNMLEKKIFPYKLAVSGKRGTLKLHLSSDNTGGHSIYGAGKIVNVKTTTLKDIFLSNNIDICDVLKIDIEGSEYDVLYNLPDIYFSRIKYICMEYHDIDASRKNHGSLIKFLKKKGFDVMYDSAIIWADRHM